MRFLWLFCFVSFLFFYFFFVENIYSAGTPFCRGVIHYVHNQFFFLNIRFKHGYEEKKDPCVPHAPPSPIHIPFCSPTATVASRHCLFLFLFLLC